MKLHARTLVFALVAALVGALGALEPVLAQDGSGRARVLVATFQTSGGIDDDLGEEIGDRLTERVRDFDLLTSVDEEELEDALDRFELDPKDMDLISWRQLASRLNAQLIVYGEVSRGGSSGNRVDAVFVEASGAGEETEVPEFTVQGDGGDAAESVADEIATRLDRLVDFLSARFNCQDYLSSGQLDAATRTCDRALEIRPSSAEALYLRGQIAREQENWDAAVEYLDRAVEEDASHEDALQAAAYAHAQAGNRERSVELYREYLEFNPDDQDVRLNVAYNLASAGAYPAAMEILQDGIRRDSSSAALWKYLGDVALRQGTEADEAQVRGGSTISDTSAIQTALDAYRQYVSLRPDSADASLYRNMTNVQQTLGRVDEALELANEALQRLEDAAGSARASLWSKKADLLASQEDLGGAVTAMDSVLLNDSTYQRARFKRGRFLLRRGEGEAAMEDLRAAEEAGTPPNDIAQSLFATGYQRYYQEDRFRRAAEMFESALEFVEEPQLERQIHFWAGYSWYRLARNIDEDNQEEACEPARRAQRILERVPDHVEQAGDVQAESQQQITQATDGLLYRQEQIQRASCED